MPITEAQAKAIAEKLDTGFDEFFAAPREDKVQIVKAALDRQIGSEVTAKVKTVPGMPFLEGPILEGISDAVLDQVAKFVVDKWFGPAKP